LDSNPCTFAQPCRSFQRAHDVLATDGEIDVLDPAGYGAVTITKSISIQGHGFAGLAVTFGTGMTINAGANDKINLRGLLIDGVGTGNVGIQFNAGGSLNIQDCLVRNFTQFGIRVSGSAQLHISDTLVADITANPPTSTAGQGIKIDPSAGNVTAVLSRVRVDGAHFVGLAAGDANQNSAVVNISVEDSEISNSSAGFGILASAPVPSSAQVMVRNSSFNYNFIGIQAQQSANAIVRVTRSSITGNATGVVGSAPAIVYSYGDNSLDGNTVNGTFTSTIPLQ